MAQVRPFRRYKALNAEFSPANETSIEKIDARIAKDVRASSATFGILQHIDKAQQETGKLRRLAEKLRATTAYHAKRDLSSGDTYPIYPGVPPMGQRDVRQMRKAKPGIVPKQEGFN